MLGLGLWLGMQNTGGGGTPSPTPTPISATTMIKTAEAVRDVRDAGSGLVTILHFGDSTTLGVGGGDGGDNLLNASNVCPPKRLAIELNDDATLNDFLHSSDAWMAVSNRTISDYNSYSAQVSIPSGWTSTGSGDPTLGGGMLKSNTDTGWFTMTPVHPYDTVMVIYGKDTIGGNMDINIEGGSTLGTVSCNAATSGFETVTYTNVHGTGSAGTGNVRLRGKGTNSALPIAILCWDSSIKTMLHIQAGIGGYDAGEYAQAYGKGYSPLPVLAGLAPDGVIYNLGINDWIDTDTPEQFDASSRAILDVAAVSAGIAIVLPWSSATSVEFQGNQDQFIKKMRLMAIDYNAPVFDLYDHFGPNANWEGTLGYGDGIHPNAAGYLAQAEYMAPIFSGIFTGDTEVAEPFRLPIVAEYLFNEGTGLFTDNVGPNDASTNTGTWVADGLQIGVGQSALVPNNNSMESVNSMIVAVFTLNEVSAAQYLFSNDTSPNNTRQKYLRVNADGSIQCSHRYGASTTATNFSSAPGLFVAGGTYCVALRVASNRLMSIWDEGKNNYGTPTTIAGTPNSGDGQPFGIGSRIEGTDPLRGRLHYLAFLQAPDTDEEQRALDGAVAAALANHGVSV